MDAIDLAGKFSLFDQYWSLRIVGAVNDSYVKLAKFNGEFVCHSHEHEDELFLDVKGRLIVRIWVRDVQLDEGQMFIVERGVEHQPVAESEAHVLIVEPKATLNTGDVVESACEVLRKAFPIMPAGRRVGAS